MAERISVLIKFPAELLARVEAHAKGAGENRMAAILALIERGLDRSSEPVPAPANPASPRSPTTVVRVEKPKGLKTTVGTGRRVTNGPITATPSPRISVTVPLAGTFKRPIYQKGAKR